MATRTKPARSTSRSRARKAPGAKNAAAAAERKAQADALRARFDDFEADPDNAALIAMALATFAGYSDRNAALIAMQMPTATCVAGYGQWQDQGRQVRRGEHAIKILAPAGSAMVRDESAPDDDSKATERRFFRMANVFDVSQTMTLAEAEAQRAAELAEQESVELAA